MSSSIPPDLAAAIASAMGSEASPDPVVQAAPLGGGCIHPAIRIRTRAGKEACLKWALGPGVSGFGVEARGLEALEARGGVRIPRVLGVDPGGADRRGWLLLEFVRPGREDRDRARRLGEGLAHLHRPEPVWAPGWDEDGWLAFLRQVNPPLETWPEFWMEARLLPRWISVAPGFSPGVHRSFEETLAGMPDLLAGWEEDGISLLHGDLWAGNVLLDEHGLPALVDPAVYRGHWEVDLATLELFGGFPSEGMDAYRG